MPEPLKSLLQRVPEHSEPASPFPAQVSAHGLCLHPDRGHPPRSVTVLAVLERTAVVADRSDIRWLEPHAAVLVDQQRFRWRPVAEQRARDASSRRTGQRRSKQRAASRGVVTA